jgi:hypothetical protein
MTLSLVQVALERFGCAAIPLYTSFPIIVGVVAIVSVTPEVPMEHLVDFYKRTGIWGFRGP